MIDISILHALNAPTTEERLSAQEKAVACARFPAVDPACINRHIHTTDSPTTIENELRRGTPRRKSIKGGFRILAKRAERCRSYAQRSAAFHAEGVSRRVASLRLLALHRKSLAALDA